MKYTLATVIFLAALLAHGLALGGTLTTANYVVEITHHCEEGVVACDDVTYVGTSKRSGGRLELKGKTWHTLCADGVTPCRFQGYIFENGGYTYTVYERGVLQVMQGEAVLVEESGEWSY